MTRIREEEEDCTLWVLFFFVPGFIHQIYRQKDGQASWLWQLFTLYITQIFLNRFIIVFVGSSQNSMKRLTLFQLVCKLLLSTFTCILVCSNICVIIWHNDVARNSGCLSIIKGCRLVFLSASLYVSKRGAYWDRLCCDVVGRWLVVTRVHCGQTVHPIPRPIVTTEH